jgi:hypothetical protein
MESHDAEFREGGSSYKPTRGGEFELCYEQVRALAELLDAHSIIEISHNFHTQRDRRKGHVKVKYISREGGFKENIVWRRDQGEI